jgi:hypothetical protein
MRMVHLRNTGPVPFAERTEAQGETDEEIGGNEADTAADDEVRAVMARELELVPVKSGVELALAVAEQQQRRCREGPGNDP